MFSPFAPKSSWVAASRTWPILPGADCSLAEKDGLYRVDDDQRRLQSRDLLQDAFQAGFCQEVQWRAADAQPLPARLDLVLGLFTGTVEHRADGLRDVRRRLQQQRRLTNPGFAAKQHE